MSVSLYLKREELLSLLSSLGLGLFAVKLGGGVFRDGEGFVPRPAIAGSLMLSLANLSLTNSDNGLVGKDSNFLEKENRR